MRKLVNVIAGLLIPIRVTSRLYLADRLGRYGVDVARITQPCLQELADDVLVTTRSIAALSRKNWREIVTDHLDGAAVNFTSLLLDGPEDGDMPAEYREHFAEIFRRHGVPLPLKRA